LEELIERKDYDCAMMIKKGWKVYNSSKHALDQRAMIAAILRGNKERRRESVERQFIGEYTKIENNIPLKDIIGLTEKSELQNSLLFSFSFFLEIKY
jgi:myosin-1